MKKLCIILAALLMLSACTVGGGFGVGGGSGGVGMGVGVGTGLRF